MRVTLEPHPDSPAPDIRIEAEVERRGAGRLVLRYVVTGDVAAVQLPEPAPPGRAEQLWRHSCFEAFVRVPAEAGYFELNLAPSGQWAAYRFSDYRDGMAPADEVPAPEMELRCDAVRCEFAASVDLEPALALDLPWRLALTAVIEAADGNLSYWSVAHAPGEPDFHHRDCFAVELPPPPRQ